MFFQRFYDTNLAQASYMIGCQRTGNALVVDANRELSQYVNAAIKEGLRITHVTETHIHADFVSGSRALAKATGATILLPDEGDADWKYAFAAEPNVQLLHDGDQFMVGNIHIDVLHTPGHTPEHLSFLVTDTPAAAGAWGILTGDFVFVGDVGRPDLLEKAAHQTGTMEASARALFHSLQRFRDLPDHLQLWPGHGAGSACGKALGAIASSTVGYEKIANWGVATTDESEFVRTVLDGQPEPPRYFAEMKRINKLGVIDPASPPNPPTMTGDNALALLLGGAVVIDTRVPGDFAGGHILGSLNISYNNSFSTRVGSLVAYDRDIYLIADDKCTGCAERAVHDLFMIGLDRVKGIISSDVFAAYERSGKSLETVVQASVAEVAEMIANHSAVVVDVRSQTEWDAGHLPGARHIPLGSLPEHLDSLRTGQTVIVHCQGGARSAIAASLLLAHEIPEVVNLAGGFVAWQKDGAEVERSITAQTHASAH